MVMVSVSLCVVVVGREVQNAGGVETHAAANDGIMITQYDCLGHAAATRKKDG